MWYQKIGIAKSIYNHYCELDQGEQNLTDVYKALNRYLYCVPLSKTTLIPHPIDSGYRKLRRPCNLLSMCPFCQLRMKKAVYEFISKSNHSFCKHSYLLDLSEFSSYEPLNDTVVTKVNQIVNQVKDFLKNNSLQPALYYAYKYHNAVDMKLYEFVTYSSQKRKGKTHIIEKKYEDKIIEQSKVENLTKFNVQVKDKEHVKDQIDLNHIGLDFMEVLQFSKFKKPYKVLLKN